ncbi:MAG: NADH-quinone oxidoreductase subunit K [Acidimicrobiales bacterium]
MTVLLALTAAALFGIGTYLVLQHTLSRILIGLALLSHAGNVLLMGSGSQGSPPLIGAGEPDGFADPLAQAFALTAIVISFGVSALLLALSYRSWILTGKDEVEDDVADRVIASGGYEDKEVGDEEAWQDEGDPSLDASAVDTPVGGLG